MANSVISVQVGEEVLVCLEMMGRLRVHVLRLVEDVNQEAAAYSDEDPEYKGPGFEGEILPGQNESGTLIFALAHVVSRAVEYDSPFAFGGVYGR